MKYPCYRVAAALCLLLVVGCAPQESANTQHRVESGDAEPQTASVSEPPPAHRTVDVQLDTGPEYARVDQFVASPHLDLIVRGKVLRTEYVYSHESAWTICTVRVLESWNPDVVQGETITVVDYGGVTSLANLKRDSGAGNLADSANKKRDTDNTRNNAIPSADEAAAVTMTFAGEPLAKSGDEAVYFLSREDTMAIMPGTFYVPVGAYQGKFLIKHGVARRHVPRDPNRAAASVDSLNVPALRRAIDAAVASSTVGIPGD